MNLERSPFRKLHHRVDLCVVGGGMAGVCAAVAAARHGAKVVLMQDRPVLGGNASGEIGVHILGADRNGFVPYARETGLLEEILRQVKIPVEKTVEGIRLTIDQIYAAETTELFGFYID